MTQSRWTVAERVLGVLTALLTLATGFLAYKTAIVTQAKDQAQVVAADRSTDLSALQRQYDTLKSENDATQAENVRLRAQLGLSGPTANPQAPAGATVRHRGQIVLASSGSAINLDAPESDPQWGGSGSDIDFNGSRLQLYSGTQTLILQDVKADYTSCRERTGYGYPVIDLGSLKPGAYLCMKTSDKRYSALRLADFNSSSATFDVVTYDPPDS